MLDSEIRDHHLRTEVKHVTLTMKLPLSGRPFPFPSESPFEITVELLAGTIV